MRFAQLIGTGLAGLMFSIAPAMAADDADVPSGVYKNDPNHTTLLLSVKHLGLAPYAVGLTKVDATVSLNVETPASTTVAVKADANSVFTNYRGDYAATHKNSPYKSWEEAVAKQFLGAEKQPEITFKSTSFTMDGKMAGTLKGDLSMAGVTKPATFSVKLTGQSKAHPFTKTPAVGFVAEGVVKRSDYGIAKNLDAFISDEVTVYLSADFIMPPKQN